MWMAPATAGADAPPASARFIHETSVLHMDQQHDIVPSIQTQGDTPVALADTAPSAPAEYSTAQSRAMHERARRSLAGGIASVARVFPGPWPYPPYLVEGHGSRVTDVDGNEYIDYNLAHGPLILGHRPPELTEAMVRILQERGSSFALSHNLEFEAAEKVVE